MAFESSQCEDMISSLSTENNSLWKLCKRMKNKKPPSPTTLTHDGAPLATIALEKADLFENIVVEQFSPNPGTPSFADFNWQVENEVATLTSQAATTPL